MGESAPTRSRPKLPRRPDGNRQLGDVARQLEDAIVRDYTAWRGHPPQPVQLELLLAFVLQLAGAVRFEGLVFHRSWLQVQRGICRHAGRWRRAESVDDAKDNFRPQMRRMLRYLIGMGWVESYEAVYASNGEGEGILLRVSPNAPVAQLDRAADF